MTEKILRFRWLIIAVVVLAFAPKTVQAQTMVTFVEPLSGNGSPDDPYQIANEGNLYWFANEVNNNSQTSICAVLTRDITVNNDVLDSDGNLNSENTDFYEWTPIGNSNRYTGTFDGQGYTISGLYINKEITASVNFVNVGLFGAIGNGGTIKNVGVEDSYFSVTINSANIQDGSDLNIGGICGENNEGTITNCYNTGTVSGTGDNDAIGGVCGFNNHGSNAKITDCHNKGTVSGLESAYIGGVCGYNDAIITNCYYLTDENDSPKGIGQNTSYATENKVEGKNADEFGNGSVAWLFNENATDGSTTPEKTSPWLQNLSTDSGDKYPVLRANTANGVCPIVVKDGDDNYKNGKHSYKNTAATPDAGTENLYSYICGNCMGLSTYLKLIKELNGKNYKYSFILEKNGSEWESVNSAFLYDDPSDNWYKVPVEFTISDVTYNRTVATEWSTLCLPYKITISNYADKCKFYELKSVETDKITLTELTENIEAGTPVFIKRNSESVTEISFEESDVKMIQTPKEQTANGNRLVGAFNTVELTMDDNSNCLFLKNDNMWSVMQANKTMTVKPFRAYIVPATSSGAPQRSITIDGEATAISDALDTLNDANAEYYDMSGRRISSLQKGVNIIRGGNKTRKVIIK